MGNGTYSHRSLVDIYTGTDAPQLGNVAAWNIFLEWQVFDTSRPRAASRTESSRSSWAPRRASSVCDSPPTPFSLLHTYTRRAAHAQGPAQPASAHPCGDRHAPAAGAGPAAALARVALYVSASRPATARGWRGALGMKAYAHWPEFFAARGRRAPRSHTATPLALAWGRLRDDGSGSAPTTDADGCTVWDILARDATHARRFAASMTGSPFREVRVTGPGAVYDFAWVAAAAAVGIEKERPLLVDVGGGKGQLLREIRGRVPGHPGRAVRVAGTAGR